MKYIATFSEPLLEPTCSTPLLSCNFSKIDFQKISFSHGLNSLSFYFLILNKSHFNKLFLTIFILGVNDFIFIFIFIFIFSIFIIFYFLFLFLFYFLLFILFIYLLSLSFSLTLNITHLFNKNLLSLSSTYNFNNVHDFKMF